MTWHTKEIGGYTRTSQEAYDNCLEIYGLLHSKGWTLNAVVGVLGNMESESGYNPWRWQSDIVLASTDDYRTQNAHAYGLVQFDPASKYIDNASTYAGYGPKFSDTAGRNTDGVAQILFINDRADYIPIGIYPPYNEYKVNTNTPAWNAECWFRCYERGTWDAGRIAAAQYWFETLGGVVPPTPAGKLPYWLLKKIRNNNFDLI